MNEEDFVDHIVQVLNTAIKTDPEIMNRIMITRFKCNQAMVDSEKIVTTPFIAQEETLNMLSLFNSVVKPLGYKIMGRYDSSKSLPYFEFFYEKV